MKEGNWSVNQKLVKFLMIGNCAEYAWKVERIQSDFESTENCCCTSEFFVLTSECLAAKLMKIVPVMCGFRSRPIMCSSLSQLCLSV